MTYFFVQKYWNHCEYCAKWIELRKNEMNAIKLIKKNYFIQKIITKINYWENHSLTLYNFQSITFESSSDLCRQNFVLETYSGAKGGTSCKHQLSYTVDTFRHSSTAQSVWWTTRTSCMCVLHTSMLLDALKLREISLLKL